MLVQELTLFSCTAHSPVASTMNCLIVLLAVVQAQLAHGQSYGTRRRTPSPPLPPTPANITVWHLFEPKYTGLANKDGGDFRGDVHFFFLAFQAFEKSNPEADIADNIFEMSTVTVQGWGEYVPCNAPGASDLQFKCPSNSTSYCCSNKTAWTADTFPGVKTEYGGFWYSFPMESEGKTWTEKVERRIKSSCLAEAWRSDAGGCPDCGSDLDQCVATCIQSTLAPGDNYTALQATWDRVFNDTKLCPDQPFPETASMLLV